MKSCTTVTWHSQSLRRNPPTASLFLFPLLPSAALKMASQMVQWVKNLPAMQEAQGSKPWDRKISWRRKMATHSSILGWKSPWTEDSDGLQSKGSQNRR